MELMQRQLRGEVVKTVRLPAELAIRASTGAPGSGASA
jgi:hypothetical protein